MQRYRVWPFLDGVEVQMCSEGEYVVFADHEAAVRKMRVALEMAQAVLYDELVTACESFCPPCEFGEEYDYSQLKPDERELITKTEAALDAVTAALSESRRLLEGGKG